MEAMAAVVPEGNSAPWMVMKREEKAGMYVDGVNVPVKVTSVAATSVLLSSKATACGCGRASPMLGDRLIIAGYVPDTDCITRFPLELRRPTWEFLMIEATFDDAA